MPSPSLLSRAAKGLLAWPPAWRAATAVAGAPGATVLMYHRIVQPGDPFPGLDVGGFRDQMRWLREACTPIAPEALRDAAHAARSPRPRVLVTFDDGYRDYHDNAFPILRDLGIPALVFLATGFIDDGGLGWWDALYLAVRRTERRSLRLPWAAGEALSLDSESGRARALAACKERLKGLDDDARRAALEALLRDLGVEPAALVGRQMMTWDEVRATQGLTRYGGHTHTHPIMSRVGPERLDAEIRTCRERIRAETGTPPRFFAYPNGRGCDFDDEAKRLLAQHGFEMAFSTIEGVNGPDADWMALRRIPASGDRRELAWRILGARRAGDREAAP